MGCQGVGDVLSKNVAVNGQGLAGRNPCCIGRLHDQGPQTAHFFFQQTDRRHQRSTAKGIGTDQFGQFVRMVGVGGTDRTHFVQADGDALAGELPGGLTAG